MQDIKGVSMESAASGYGAMLPDLDRLGNNRPVGGRVLQVLLESSPLAVEVMAEAGVDISGHRSSNVSELMDVPLDCVGTVRGHANETCRACPGRKAKVAHVGFDDPPCPANSAKSGKEALVHHRRVRDEIRAFVESLPGSLVRREKTG